MARGYNRTCRKCGAAWHISEDDFVALKRNEKKRTGASITSYIGSVMAAAEIERSRLEDRIERGKHCPDCGSTDYDQVRPKAFGDRKFGASDDRDMDKVARLKLYIKGQKQLGRKINWLQANEELNALEQPAEATAANVIDAAAVRACPFCAEEIKAAAIKCKHCGSAVEVSSGLHDEAAAPPPPSWHPDPLGRNELRYWDGVQWTSNVSNGGTTTLDPV